MTDARRCLAVLVAALALSGCATVPVPAGPSVLVMPSPGKPLDLFQYEDAVCRQWAQRQIGASPQEIADQNTASGAAVGTAIGAVAGAALGSASGHAAEGMIIGAGSGMLLGATSGAQAGTAYGWEAQRRYDIAYQQCMYAQGNVLPGMPARAWRSRPPPPPPGWGYPSQPPNPQAYPPPPPPPGQ